MPFLFFFLLRLDDEEASTLSCRRALSLLRCTAVRRSEGTDSSERISNLVSSSCFSSSSLAKASSSLFSLALASRVWRVRKDSAEESKTSPDASTGRPRVGWVSPTKRRKLRSLRCGRGSSGRPGRSPGGGVFCARRPECDSSTTSSLAVAIFWCRSMLYASRPPSQLWCGTVATAALTLCASCRHHERRRLSRRRRALEVPPPSPSRAAIGDEATRWGQCSRATTSP